MSLAGGPPVAMKTGQKIGTLLGLFGLGILTLATFNVSLSNQGLWLSLALLSIGGGILVYSKSLYKDTLPGIKNHGVWLKSISNRGFWAWVAGISLTGFYIVLYFFAELLGQGSGGAENTGLIGLFDPLSYALKANLLASGLYTERFTLWPFWPLVSNSSGNTATIPTKRSAPGV